MFVLRAFRCRRISLPNAIAELLCLVCVHSLLLPRLGSQLAHREHVDGSLVLAVHLQHGVETVIQKGACRSLLGHSTLATLHSGASLVQVIGTDDQPVIRGQVDQVNVYPSVGYAATDLP